MLGAGFDLGESMDQTVASSLRSRPLSKAPYEIQAWSNNQSRLSTPRDSAQLSEAPGPPKNHGSP